MRLCSILLVLLSFALQVSCNKPSRSYVGPMEANHPWMVFDPTKEQGRVYPCGDQNNPDVIYLVFVMKGGDAVKINLRNKEISPHHFNVAKWDDVVNQTVRFDLGYRFQNPNGPLWFEFRGGKEEKEVNHLHGDPIPVHPGTRKATRRTGYYYIMDKQGDKPIERLRVRIENSELSWGGLGSTCLSPNGKWLIFALDNNPSRIFIFDRNEKAVELFQTDRDDQILEIVND